MTTEPVNLLWSGGFDSTYRLTELLAAGRDVRTIYVEGLQGNHKPIKQDLELAARGEILKLLPQQLKKHLVEQVGIPRSVWDLEYERCLQEIESATGLKGNEDFSMQAPLMPAIASIVGELECCYVSTDDANQAVILAELHNVRFPTLHLTKPAMLERATKMGFRQLLERTWSCEKTDGAVVCGRCVGCRPRVLPQIPLT